jgi:hypothetical protein
MKSKGTDANNPDLSTRDKSPMDASQPDKKQDIKSTKNSLMARKTEGMYSKQKIVSSFLMHFYFSNHCV